MTTKYAENKEVAPCTVEESRASYRTDGDELLYDILERVGILRKSNTGWTRELNVISWNGSAPRFDIRDWDPRHEKMSKGITFTKAEAAQICEWLTKRGMEPVPGSAKASAQPMAEEDVNQDAESSGDVPF